VGWSVRGYHTLPEGATPEAVEFATVTNESLFPLKKCSPQKIQAVLTATSILHHPTHFYLLRNHGPNGRSRSRSWDCRCRNPHSFKSCRVHERFVRHTREPTRLANGSPVWTSLITNTNYLPGLLALDYSLKKAGTKYPLIALYTDTFPEEGHKALDLRGIPKKRVNYLLPTVHKDYSNDPRFYDCWSKLTPFSLVEYQRVVQLDSDMLVLKNMDELMELELDAPDVGGKGDRVFAASHACVCNPLKKPHYPKDWYVHGL
jgi:hypothetical protein